MLTARWATAAKIGTAIVVAMVLLVALAGRERTLTAIFGPIQIMPVTFADLRINSKPNQFLVCPINYCAAKPHMVSPTYDIPVEELRQRWMTMLKDQPQIKQGAIDEQAMQYDYIQRTSLMRFPDSITVQFIALENGHSSLAIYSRSHYGKSDFGANEKRIRAWLAALGKLGPGSSSGDTILFPAGVIT